MAKPRRIPGLRPDDAFLDAADKVLSVRTDELFGHAAGVLDIEDIERVHDMRVATRRLRAALEIFAPCYECDAHRRALTGVKALADALGARRDPDVQIRALDRLANGFPPQDAAGVRGFADRLRAEQAQANSRLAEALQDAHRGELAACLTSLAQRAEPG